MSAIDSSVSDVSVEKIQSPFPPLGEMRIWETHYVKYRIAKIPILKWTQLPGFREEQLRHVPDTYGVYMFVRHNIYPSFNFPTDKIGYVCYVGKSENLRARIDEYIKIAYGNKKGAVREYIERMFKHCGISGLSLYYSMCSPEDYSFTEETLIQVFDPIFNINSRLDEAKFNNFIHAVLAAGEPAFPPR